MKLLHLSKGHKYICGEKDFLWRVQSDKKINSSLTKTHETWAAKCLKNWRSWRCFVYRQWICSPEPSALFLQSERSWGEVERRNSPDKVIFHSQGFECTIRERIIQEIYFWSVETQEVWKSFACSHFSFPSFSAVEVIKLVCAEEKLKTSVNTWNPRCEGISWFYKVTCWRSWALLASKHKSNDSV